MAVDVPLRALDTSATAMLSRYFSCEEVSTPARTPLILVRITKGRPARVSTHPSRPLGHPATWPPVHWAFLTYDRGRGPAAGDLVRETPKGAGIDARPFRMWLCWFGPAWGSTHARASPKPRDQACAVSSSRLRVRSVSTW